MTLQIIGPGFGRTGTKSTKDALEMLGFGPCHHMLEVMANPAQVPHWVGLSQTGDIDLAAAFAGYRSQIDWPGAQVWRELAAAYPDAKVLLTERPEDSWWRSFSGTIGKLFRVADGMAAPPHVRAMMDTYFKTIEAQAFPEGHADRDAAIAAYRRRGREVREAIPAERLLVFDVADGWAPLCGFLGVPVPDAPFPHRNLRDDFWDSLGGEPPD